MARESVTFEAVPTSEVAYEDDIQAAFDSWRDGLADSESPGSIRVFRVPMDAQGNASHSASGQVRLGTWPVDHYTFDTLCDKIVKEFMLPTESMMAIRLIGTMTGKSGVKFNKIVTLQRPNVLGGPVPGMPKDSVSEIMGAIQASNERMFRMIQEMKGGSAAPSEGMSTQLMQMVAMMTALNKPVTDMMAPMFAALAGRPLPAPGPSSSMKDTLETLMMADKFLARRGGGGGPPEPDWMKLTTAVAGVAKPLLEMAAANSAQGTRNRRALAAPQNPQPAQPAQPAPAAPLPVHAPAGVDLSRPSPLPPGSLTPGPSIDTPSSQIPQGGNPQETQGMFAETKHQIDALVEVAASGADPVAVANLFFEETMLDMKDDDYSKLAASIESDNFMTALTVYNVRARDHAEWFGALRAQLIHHIKAADAED